MRDFKVGGFVSYDKNAHINHEHLGQKDPDYNFFGRCEILSLTYNIMRVKNEKGKVVNWRIGRFKPWRKNRIYNFL